MLAYSSVAHAGYLLVAMVAGKDLGGAATDVLSGCLRLHESRRFLVWWWRSVSKGVQMSKNEELSDYNGLGFSLSCAWHGHGDLHAIAHWCATVGRIYWQIFMCLAQP